MHTPPVPRDPVDRKPTRIVPSCDCFVEKGMTFDHELGHYVCSKCGHSEVLSGRSLHQQRIEEFMVGIGHAVSDQPHLPDHETRLLRAKIILEEAIETVNALGFYIQTRWSGGEPGPCIYSDIKGGWTLHDTHDGPDLVEIADGCADLSVVTIGTLSACGIADGPVLEAVDENNLTKVKPLCPECRHQMSKIIISGQHEWWQCNGFDCGRRFQKEVGGYEREDGKWVKGTAHQKVDLAKVLKKQYIVLPEDPSL